MGGKACQRGNEVIAKCGMPERNRKECLEKEKNYARKNVLNRTGGGDGMGWGSMSTNQRTTFMPVVAGRDRRETGVSTNDPIERRMGGDVCLPGEEEILKTQIWRKHIHVLWANKGTCRFINSLKRWSVSGTLKKSRTESHQQGGKGIISDYGRTQVKGTR